MIKINILNSKNSYFYSLKQKTISEIFIFCYHRMQISSEMMAKRLLQDTHYNLLFNVKDTK